MLINAHFTAGYLAVHQTAASFICCCCCCCLCFGSVIYSCPVSLTKQIMTQERNDNNNKRGEIKSLHFIEVADIQPNIAHAFGCRRLPLLLLLLLLSRTDAARPKMSFMLVRISPGKQLPLLQSVALLNMPHVHTHTHTHAKVLARNARGNTISALGPCLFVVAVTVLCVTFIWILYVCLAARDMTEHLGILAQTAGGTIEPEQAFCCLVNSLLDCVISYENGLCLHFQRLCDKKEEEQAPFI